MCGRFAQYEKSQSYVEAFNTELSVDLGGQYEDLGRYNVCPGSQVLIFNQREEGVFIESLNWGYLPQWAREMGRNHMINARGETAASSKMFQQLWSTGRILVPANGWFEWQTLPGRRKQPFYITHRSGKPIFFAAICKNYPDKKENHDDGFAIVTVHSDGGLLDIHDRRPLVMDIKASREWLDRQTSSEHAEELSRAFVLPASEFRYWPVSSRVGNVRTDNPSLIKAVNV